MNRQDILLHLRSSNKNPFHADRVSDPWVVTSGDVDDLNHIAFDAVVKEIDLMRDAPQCRGLLILGEAGTGKTHLLARVHQRLAQKNHLLFVPRPTNPEAVLSTIWNKVVESLHQPKPQEENVTQGDLLLRDAFAGLLSKSIDMDSELASKTRDDYARVIDRMRRGEATVDDLEKGVRNRIRDALRDHHKATSKVHDLFLSGLLNYFVYRDRARRRLVLEYLTNYEIDEDSCKELGLPPWAKIAEDSNDTDLAKRQEQWALDGIRVLSELATYGRPLVLAFDQVEGMRDRLALTRAWGDAIREIMDQGRNIVVICCVFPSLWREWFTKNLSEGGAPLEDSVIQRVAAKQVSLESLSFNHAKRLVAKRLQSALQPFGAEVDEYFPFTETTIREAYDAQAGRGVRVFIQQCAERFTELVYAENGKSNSEVRSPVAVFSECINSTRLPDLPSPEKDLLGKAGEIVQELLLVPGFEPTKSWQKKVVPDHFVVKLPSGEPTAIALSNKTGIAFTARLRNWTHILEKDPATQFFFFRSSRTPRPSEQSVGALLIRKMGESFVRLSDEQERAFLGLHSTLVALQEGDLWCGDKKLTISDLRESLEAGGFSSLSNLVPAGVRALLSRAPKQTNQQPVEANAQSPVVTEPPEGFETVLERHDLFDELETRANAIEGLSSTSSTKYDEFKTWIDAELGGKSAVCFLSEMAKQWTPRVGQAIMGTPKVLFLLVRSSSVVDMATRLVDLHRYVSGLHATVVLLGDDGAWKVGVVAGTHGRPLFDRLSAIRPELASASSASDKVSEEPRAVLGMGEFMDKDLSEQAELVWGKLVGQGAVEFDEAIRSAANALRDEGWLNFQRLHRDGSIYAAIEKAISWCSRRGLLFDRPGRGVARAIIPHADGFHRDHWRDCILDVVDENWITRDDLVRATAERAIEVFGLDMQRLRGGGRADTAIRSTINGLIRLGKLEREGAQLLRKGNGHTPVNEGDDELKPSLTVTSSASDVVQSRSFASSAAQSPDASRASELRAMLGDIPGEAEPVLIQLLALPLKDPTELLAAVDAHLKEFEDAFEVHTFLDMNGAEGLARDARGLLDLWPSLSPADKLLAQSAILYFVESDEADDDFRIGGLRTDRAVMDTVKRVVFREPAVAS